MTVIDLETARRIIAASRARSRELGLKPLTIAVLDAGAVLVALEREDGTSRLRPDMAIGKANGALALGIGSRAIGQRAETQPYFVQSVNALAGGSLVPVPGGVLIRAAAGGAILGAVGITGDTSDNDEAAAIAGIEAVGLVGDGG
jgi:uncharacterized protein GlcG (DUF336 family)